MLIDLTSDYVRFLNKESLTEKKQRFVEVNDAMQAAGKGRTKNALKAVFLESFVKMLEIIIDSEFDDAKY